MKFRTKTAIAAIAFVAGFGTFQLFAATGGATYGPYTCQPCGLVNPMPDPATTVFINTMNNGSGMVSFNKLNMAVGDRIVICNRTHCVDYYRTNSGNYLGENARENKAPGSSSGQGSGAGGGGGSGGGETGGGAAGGGSVAPGPIGSGTVIVRPPRKNPV